MYYIVESENVGPNLDSRRNSHTFEITTVCPQKNMSHQDCADGWLGTTNDIDRNAHGEYETEEEARGAVAGLLDDEGRELDVEEAEREEYGIVARFAASKPVEWDREGSIQWCYEGRNDITPETTDEQIEALVEGWRKELIEAESAALDTDAVDQYMREHRDSLRG